MHFEFTPITMEYVKEIDGWDFSGFAEEVMMTPYFESYEKDKSLKGPAGCDGFVAIREGEPVGLFEFNLKGNRLEIGLALRPDLVGKGSGADYVRQGIAFGVQYYDSNIDVVELVVDASNKAAIRVYEKVGFTRIEEDENEIEMKMEL
ncbi:GNAT family N-acetyltransferase [Halobacillus salinus]|uniref:GNAT family N-acetyltransferase n=1 Tax=Halobacillus salinus TaxID=192814 RepID=UPI0009A861A0|nr:GNAT family N-acetyltransferase [Halobacillus salinus]